MATSPNYSWPEPDNTDLVKNGALAIRTMGNAIDTTMATMTPKSTYPAKGSIAAATGASTPANLSVGNNGETLVADSSTSTGLRYQSNFAAGKNKIINGDFGIWQRGTSFSNPSSDAYNADRFKLSYDGTGATRTVSQQSFTAGTAPVAGYEGTYFYRCATTVAGTGNTLIWMKQFIEDVRTFAGQTATLSFWAKADTSRTLPNIGFEQYFGSGGSASVYSDTANVAITSSWARYSLTIAIPSISGKTLGTGNALIAFIKFPTGIATIDIWGVQVEASNTATAFQTATGTIQGELAACQRYYYRNTAGVAYANFATGQATSTTATTVYIAYPVTMRIAPSAIETTGTSANYIMVTAIGGTVACTAITHDSNTSTNQAIFATTVSTGLVAGSATSIRANNSTTAYLGWSAEL
jgi:hypothetical protein